MARSRNIKPGFFSNEVLGVFDARIRLLFAGLWCYADRDGRLEDRPARIKAEILPYDDLDVDAALDTLAQPEHGPFIIRYEVEGKRYIQVVKFREHQSPHNTEKPSVIPGVPVTHPLHNATLTTGYLGNQESGISCLRKGDARGKPRVTADMVPVPDGWNTGDVLQAIRDWLEYKTNRGEPYKDAAYLGRKIKSFASPAAFIAAVDNSIGNNYAGIYPAKDINAQPKHTGSGQRYRGPLS